MLQQQSYSSAAQRQEWTPERSQGPPDEHTDFHTDTRDKFRLLGSLSSHGIITDGRRRPVCHLGVLLISGQQGERILALKPSQLLVKQAASGPILEPNIGRETQAQWEAFQQAGVPLLFYHLSPLSVFLPQWQEGHRRCPCARTSKRTPPLNS